MTTRFRLPASTHLAAVHLTTADLPRALRFYQGGVGLRVIERGDGTAVLGAAGGPLLRLDEQPGWPPKPPRSTGLYHVAIRLPSRQALARLILHLARAGWPFSGASDHAVSEALYLDDADGHGVELYRDRPRSEWQRQGDQVLMTTVALDLDSLLAEADDAPWTGIDPGADIGHIHLHIGDLAQARAFYGEALGLDVAADWSGHGALFMSAGGYHHHIGLNIWAGGAPPPPETLGLRAFGLALPDAASRAALADHLRGLGVPLAETASGALRLHDPWGHAVELVVG